MSLEMVLWAVLCGVVALLIGVLGWIGARVHNKIDELATRVETKLESIYKALGDIDHDLRADMTDLDRRVTVVETRCADCKRS
jgi:hypothetical protein